jgi:hypothetical protein
MSLTLARLCGEWRLASGKYEEVWNGKTKYSWYEYFDNIEESGKPLKKVSRKQKAVEENWKAVEEIRKPFQKAESR